MSAADFMGYFHMVLKGAKAIAPQPHPHSPNELFTPNAWGQASGFNQNSHPAPHLFMFSS